MAVHDNSMVAHIWAQRNKESGRSHNGNFHFSGAVLYSYQTAIGRFIVAPNGETVTLVNSERYSQTTSSKHMPALWRAIDYGRGSFAPCFTVPNLGNYSSIYGGRDLSAREHADNLAYLVARYNDRVAELRRKRELWEATEAQVCDSLDDLASAATRYAALFGLDAPALDAPADAAAIWSHHEAKRARLNAPGAAEKRERERLKRAERKARAERERLEFQRAANAEKIELWRAGAGVHLPYGLGTDDKGGALLRVRGDLLETGLGARVPLADAIRVYRFVKAVRARGVMWQSPPSEAIGVGAFAVTQIWPNGDFRAGCHLIRWPEIEKAAVAAGVENLAPVEPA